MHILHRLAEVSVERFDPKLNRDQIQHCLSRVLRLYNEHSDTVRGVAGGKWAEFEAYFLLTNLGTYERGKEGGRGGGEEGGWMGGEVGGSEEGEGTR